MDTSATLTSPISIDPRHKQLEWEEKCYHFEVEVTRLTTIMSLFKMITLVPPPTAVSSSDALGNITPPLRKRIE